MITAGSGSVAYRRQIGCLRLWYCPMVMRFIVCTTRSPRSRHERSNSVLRSGRSSPGPSTLCSAPINAARSSLVSATACEKKPIPVLYPVILPWFSTTFAAPWVARWRVQVMFEYVERTPCGIHRRQSSGEKATTGILLGVAARSYQPYGESASLAR